MITEVIYHYERIKLCKESSLKRDLNTFILIATTIVALGIIFGGYRSAVVQYTILPVDLIIAAIAIINLACDFLSHKHKCIKVTREVLLRPSAPPMEEMGTQTIEKTPTPPRRVTPDLAVSSSSLAAMLTPRNGSQDSAERTGTLETSPKRSPPAQLRVANNTVADDNASLDSSWVDTSKD